MKKRKKEHHLNTWVIRQPLQPRATELEPDDLALSIRWVEKNIYLVSHTKVGISKS